MCSVTLEIIKELFRNFAHKGDVVSYSELTSGHINTNYLVETTIQPWVILQKINTAVFTNPYHLLHNKVTVSNHLKSVKEQPFHHILEFIPTSTGEYVFQDENLACWNMMVYIPNTYTFQKVTNSKLAFEGGWLFGKFIAATHNLPSEKLHILLPNFHSIPFRFLQFQNAFSNATPERLEKATRYIDYANTHKESVMQLDKLVNETKIPIRVTHNDTKLSNALFTKNMEGLCVIDTDTVMPGIVHFDFGDAVRTYCSTAEEDEKDISKIRINWNNYKALHKGFLKGCEKILTPFEKETLHLGANHIIFIMGLRFLTDYLAGDTYYKIAYPEHNLVRAINQFTLHQNFSEHHR